MSYLKTSIPSIVAKFYKHVSRKSIPQKGKHGNCYYAACEILFLLSKKLVTEKNIYI